MEKNELDGFEEALGKALGQLPLSFKARISEVKIVAKVQIEYVIPKVERPKRVISRSNTGEIIDVKETDQGHL